MLLIKLKKSHDECLSLKKLIKSLESENERHKQEYKSIFKENLRLKQENYVLSKQLKVGNVFS